MTLSPYFYTHVRIVEWILDSMFYRWLLILTTLLAASLALHVASDPQPCPPPPPDRRARPTRCLRASGTLRQTEAPRSTRAWLMRPRHALVAPQSPPAAMRTRLGTGRTERINRTARRGTDRGGRGTAATAAATATATATAAAAVNRVVPTAGSGYPDGCRPLADLARGVRGLERTFGDQ